MKQLLNTTLIIFILWTAFAFSQDISHDGVRNGIEAFYMADFEEAMRLLQEAIINEILSNEEEFYAHVYVGFCHIRHNSDVGSAQLYFQRAIQVDPDEQLDPKKIPPDLYNAFMSVKNSMLGTIIVASEPEGATAVLINPSTNDVKRGRTPETFSSLPTNVYQILVSKNGYETYSSTVNVQAGATDSVKVTLLENKSSFWLTYWPYGAGALAASAAVIAIVSGGGDGDKAPPSATRETLPQPPQRP
jgi:hypothetical protein